MPDPVYVDLDLDLPVSPDTGDLIFKTDEDAIKRAIRNLVLTGKYDRPFQPHLNSRISKMLFELGNPITAIQIRSNIIDMIEQHEPRAQVLGVEVEFRPDENACTATIRFRVKNTPKTASLVVTLARTR